MLGSSKASICYFFKKVVLITCDNITKLMLLICLLIICIICIIVKCVFLIPAYQLRLSIMAAVFFKFIARLRSKAAKVVCLIRLCVYGSEAL